MRKTFLAALLAVSATLSHGEEGRRVRAVPRAAGPSSVIKMHRYNVPRPDVIRDQGRMIRSQRRIDWPARDGAGAPIVQRPARVPPRQHLSVVRSPVVVQNIDHERRVEVVPNRYYWHSVNGIKYAHYYDRRIHWYGFYHGPNFYWTAFYGDRWWWYDASFGRWVYWWNGFWWWPSPAGAVYVYVDNNYYPYNENGVTVKTPETVQPPAEVPAPNAGDARTSPDGKRTVQVFGSRSEAFLYDNSSGSPVFLKYLGQDVDKVRFSGGNDGKSLRILVDYKDGGFALFTADGDPVDADAAAPGPAGTAQPPADTPPPPPPGQ